MYIESKEEIRRRGGKSPDFSDAVVYACAPVWEGIQDGTVVGASAEELVNLRQMEDVARQLEMARAMTISPV